MTPYLSVIIPAYNEGKRIVGTLADIYDYLASQAYDWELLIVLDGPQDDTLARVKEFAAQRPGIRWIDRAQNRGKGYTVREGMLAARGSVRLFTDADNSTSITHFEKMKPLFEQGCDVVICSRDGKDVEGAHQAVPQPFFKRLLGNLGNLYIQLVAVPGIWDTQCGFKAFTEKAAEQIFALSQIDRWGFDVEALALARHFGFRTGIVPANWIDHAETHVKFWNYISVLYEALKVRWNLATGVYSQETDVSADPDTV